MNVRNAGVDSVTWLKQNLITNKKKYRYRAPKNGSASAIWLAAENIQNIHLFLFSKLAKAWLKDGQGMDDQEEWKTRNTKVSKCFHLISYLNLKIL